MTARKKDGLWVLVEGNEPGIADVFTRRKDLETAAGYCTGVDEPFTIYDLSTADTVSVWVETKVSFEYPTSDGEGAS
jgi:hypothetical protein